MRDDQRPWVTYQRVSTEDQVKEGVSLDAQREACRHLAAAGRHQVIEDIVDPGFSAKNLNRPGMKRVLGMVEGRQIAGVIVYKLDRLTRRLRDLLDLIELFDRYEVALVSVGERLDTGSAMGRFFISIIGAIAQWERETIADRVQMGMRHRLSQGGFVGGRVPVGLRAKGEPGNRVLEIHPENGPIVAKMWGMVTHGKTLRQVAEFLDRERVDSPAKDGWSPTAVQRIINNERYIGVLVSKKEQGQAIAALGNRSCPSRRKAKVTPGPSAKASRTWILSGIARCSHCDSALVGVTARGTSGKMYPYYRCTGRIRLGRSHCPMKDLSAERWEPAAVDALVRLVEKEGELEPALLNLQQQIDKVGAPMTEERKELGLQLDKIRAEVERLVELAAKGQLVGEAVAKSLTDRQQRAKEIELRMAGLEGRLAMAALTEAQIEVLLARWREGVSDLGNRPAAEQAATIRLLVKRVVLKPHAKDKEKGEVDLAIDLPGLLAPEFVSGSPLVHLGPLDTNVLCFSLAVELIFRRQRQAG